MKIRYKTKTGALMETIIEKPENLRDNSQNCLIDYIGDELEKRGIVFKWFRIID